MITYSELGQDKYLEEEYFSEKNDGFYVELGATDGIRNSNSLFFERHKNWTGLLIEPIPAYFEKLTANRPKSICEKVAIDKDFGEAELFLIKEDCTVWGYDLGYDGGHSGLNKYYEPQQRDYVNSLPCKKYIIKVPTVPMQSLFDKHNITHIDFLSLDVEGGEETVLESIDFDKVNIDVIDFEDHWENTTAKRIIKRLESLGYGHFKRLGHDVIMSKIAPKSAKV